MDKYKTLVLTEDKFGLWQDFAATSPQNTIFNSVAWLRLISSVKQAGFQIIGVFRGQELIGGCALYIENSIEGRIARFAPLSQYGGVLLSEEPSDYLHKKQRHNQQVLCALISYIEANFDYADLINHPSLVDVRPFIWNGWKVDIRYTCYTQGARLSPDIVRRAGIAVENGVKIEERFEPEIFYRLWSGMFNTKGIKPPLAFREFDRFTRQLKADGILKMFCAADNSGAVISAALLLFDQAVVYYWQAASDPGRLNLGGHQLLVKTIADDLKSRKLVMDLAGADIESISLYKSSFADRLISHYRASKAISLRARAVRSAKNIYHVFK
jgi:hypothetical protein